MYTYIVIDDEQLIRKGLISHVNEIAEEEFICIGEAANGIKGLELIEKTHPDIVVTDMKMTQMDGVEFLHRLSEREYQIPVIVISGYKAFDYMSQAIDKGVVGYVLKPFSTEEIQKQLFKAVAKIEQMESIELLQKRVQIYEERTEGRESLKIILEPWNPDDERASKLSQNNFHILVSIYMSRKDRTDILRECVKQFYPDMSVLYLENPGIQGQCFVLFSVSQADEIERIKRTFPFFFHGMEKRVQGAKTYACVGKPFYGISGLHAAYVINDKILRDIHLSDLFCVVDETTYQKKIQKIYTDSEVLDIVRDIKYSRTRQCSSLEHFFDRFDIKSTSLLEMGKACEILISKINEWAEQNQVETDRVMEVFYNRYRFCDDVEKMKKELTGYVNLIMLSIHQKNHDESYTFEQMDQYIRDRYYEKITLQTLAAQFCITSVQCSHLLKENLNMNLNAYLLSIRFEKAKQLLDSTKMSVEQISREVGYPNPKYFFRMFKSENQCTPLEYRNRRKRDAIRKEK